MGDSLICYSCGENVNTECFEKYVEMKKQHSTVQPTCGVAYCLKDRKKRFTTKRARKVNKEWKDLERAQQRLHNQRAREQIQENMQIENEEEVEAAEE